MSETHTGRREKLWLPSGRGDRPPGRIPDRTAFGSCDVPFRLERNWPSVTDLLSAAEELLTT